MDTGKQARPQNHDSKPAAKGSDRFLASLAKTLCYGLIAAALIQAMQAPDGVPSLVANPAADAAQVEALLQKISSAAPETPIVFSEEEILPLFKKLTPVIRLHNGALAKLGRFEGAYVQFQTSTVSITERIGILGYPIFMSLDWRLKNINGKPVPRLEGGHIGRLSLPPSLASYGVSLVQPLFTVLKTNHPRLGKLECAGVGQGKITVTRHGPVSAPAPAADPAAEPAAEPAAASAPETPAPAAPTQPQP